MNSFFKVQHKAQDGNAKKLDFRRSIFQCSRCNPHPFWRRIIIFFAWVGLFIFTVFIIEVFYFESITLGDEKVVKASPALKIHELETTSSTTTEVMKLQNNFANIPFEAPPKSFHPDVTFGSKLQRDWIFSKHSRCIVLIVTSSSGVFYFRFQSQQRSWLKNVDRNLDSILVVSDKDIVSEYALIDLSRNPRMPEKDYYAAQYRFLHGIEFTFTYGLTPSMFDFLFVIDDDTYVFWERFERTIVPLNPEEIFVYGRTNNLDSTCDRLCGGAGWITSRTYLQTFPGFYHKMWASTNNNYDYKLTRFFDPGIMKGDLDFHYARKTCSEDSAVTCHYIGPIQMEDIFSRES